MFQFTEKFQIPKNFDDWSFAENKVQLFTKIFESPKFSKIYSRFAQNSIKFMRKWSRKGRILETDNENVYFFKMI